MRSLVAQFGRFGLVGLIGLAVDLGVFNLLRLTLLSPVNLHEGPVVAKLVSTSLAIVANWLGNRYWTFGDRRRGDWRREAVEFALVSLGGLAISLGCLWVSHYALGFTSVLADNISTNVVGLVLGTAFRFTFYRLWVFGDHRSSATGRQPDLEVPEGRRRASIRRLRAPARPAAQTRSQRATASPRPSSRRMRPTAPAGDGPRPGSGSAP
jgi:putative flippase GtrA